MEIRILEERANPLMKRHEYRFEVAHPQSPTPRREEVRGELAKVVKAPKERIVIERMHARFGTSVTRGDANVYESKDAVMQITREHILVRHGLKEKAPKGPAAAPAASSPVPAGEAAKAEPSKADAAPAEPVKAVPAEPAAASASKPSHAEGAKPRAPKATPAKAERAEKSEKTAPEKE